MVLVFKGTYGSEPLQMFTPYNYAFGQSIQFTKSDMYVSNVRVYDVGGQPTDILDVALVDLSFTDKGEAEIGFEIPVKDIEAVTYERIDFVIGLSPEQNSGRPEDYPSSDPLGLPRYWEGWTSYIFAKTEGNLDTLSGNGADLGWLYHTGTDDLRVGITANANMTVFEDETTRVVFSMDHRTLLGVGEDPIDIKAKPINHNPTDTEAIGKITQNYVKSLSFVVE